MPPTKRNYTITAPTDIYWPLRVAATPEQPMRYDLWLVWHSQFLIPVEANV